MIFIVALLLKNLLWQQKNVVAQKSLHERRQQKSAQHVKGLVKLRARKHQLERKQRVSLRRRVPRGRKLLAKRHLLERRRLHARRHLLERRPRANPRRNDQQLVVVENKQTPYVVVKVNVSKTLRSRSVLVFYHPPAYLLRCF